MTQAEKKMKKYVNAVERRLNLPREIRFRVMSDFSSSISARRESGMSDEEIYAELGTPKKAAAELNAQMQEFTYRKSPWRYLFAAAAAYGAAELLGELAAWLVILWTWGEHTIMDASSVGIIGGADGPTAIFVTANIGTLPSLLISVTLLSVGIWGFMRLSRCRIKQK